MTSVSKSMVLTKRFRLASRVKCFGRASASSARMICSKIGIRSGIRKSNSRDLLLAPILPEPLHVSLLRGAHCARRIVLGESWASCDHVAIVAHWSKLSICTAAPEFCFITNLGSCLRPLLIY